MPRVLYVSSGMMNNTVAAGTCLLALLIVIHIKCLTLFNSNEVLISTVNAGTYLWVWFIMNYDICLYCTVKGGAPTDSDPGWASEYVIGLYECIVYLVFDMPYCMFVSGWEKRQGVSYYYLNSRFDCGINKIQVNQNESRTNSYIS